MVTFLGLAASIAKEAAADSFASLHEVGAVKFGCFTLKNGVQSPVYLDLRMMVSHLMMMH